MKNRTMRLAKCTTSPAIKRPFYDMNLVTSYDINSAMYSCHWVLDTLFREDHNQTRHKTGAKNQSTMRRIAHNTLKKAPDPHHRKRPSSLPKKQLRAAHDEAYLEKCLSLV
jgi:hypothetical protein